MRLKDNELEQYGDAFIPEFVYEVIRRLPRFASMRVGPNSAINMTFLKNPTARASARCGGIFRISFRGDA